MLNYYVLYVTTTTRLNKRVEDCDKDSVKDCEGHALLHTNTKGITDKKVRRNFFFLTWKGS